MSKRSVPYEWCGLCEKRGFHSEHDANKALGRAATTRNRVADRTGTRRGMHRENRFYDCDLGFYHLTSMSRKDVRQ
ncbi:hypothetical protein ACIA8K_12800 [Catenuloplanes sp. NPDC051500]|uniref:hypothetical protein n=1 Tax=Catenuloplanes sp. NPDC051500 TaxID=3363959 RepID=UPI00379B481D